MQALHREHEAQRDAILTSSADVDEMYDLLAFYGQAVPTGDQVQTRVSMPCTCLSISVLILELRGPTLLWCWQIKHDDMCEAVQRFGEQLAAAGAFLQEAWAVQAAQLQTLVSKAECSASVRVIMAMMAISG
jgi:hypothetical protein